MAKREADLRFTRIRLTNWKNFRTADVELGVRAFIVGANASGKSNFLDAFRFLRDLAKPIGGGLAAALADRGGLVGVRSLEARRPSHVEIEVDVGNDDDPRRWSYRVQFNKRLTDPAVTVTEEAVRAHGTEVAAQRRSASDDPLALSQTLLEQAKQNREFRELGDFLTSVRYLHVVPQVVRDARRAVSAGEDPFGGDLLRRINETAKRKQETRLKMLGEALRVAVPRFESLSLKIDSDGKPHLEADYKGWRPNVSKQREDVLSDGTIRFIGLLWSIAEDGGPLLLEEPELSLHEEVVQHLPAMISRAQRLSRRQVIATTHSQTMMDARGVGLDEVHRIVIVDTGNTVETVSQNAKVVAQVEGGLTVGEAVLPLTKPKDADRIGMLDLFGR